MSEARRFAPATERNREPIRRVLADVLPDAGLVLEIASGTGEHAVHLTGHYPALRYQPSDADPGARASIEAWRLHARRSNLLAPLDLDVSADDWTDRAPSPVDAVLCINMIHIAPWPAAQGLLEGAARLLAPGAPLYLYGPYRRAGQATAASNEAFDASLRDRNPEWGLRRLEDVEAYAKAQGFGPARVVEMPANNLSVVFVR